MAEALLRERAGDRFEAYSAGTEPKGIHPLTIQVLKENGIDTSKLRSKDVAEYLGTLAGSPSDRRLRERRRKLPTDLSPVSVIGNSGRSTIRQHFREPTKKS